MAIEMAVKSKNKFAQKIGKELLNTVRRISYPNGNSGYRNESVYALEEQIADLDFISIDAHFRGNAVCVAFYYLVIDDKLTPSNIRALRNLIDRRAIHGGKSGRI